MNCRDCLHFKACYEMAAAFGLEEFNTLFANQCKDFTDCSEWVHLPYKVREQEIKSKAYKEFAEKLKENTTTKFDWNDYIDIEEVDNLLKEMVGE